MFTPSELIVFSFSILGSLGMILLFITYYLNQVHYEKTKIMTDGELRFYKVLRYVVRNDYDVLAQVRLASVVKIQDKYFIWKKFNLLGAKCVDFVLIDKAAGTTKLVIELDDKSHLRADRQRRDRFVNGILKEAGIPILHKKYEGHYEEEKLKDEIQQAVSS